VPRLEHSNLLGKSGVWSLLIRKHNLHTKIKPKREKEEKKTKKILVMFAVILTALAIVGFSYATWFSSVYINGAATVGTIDLEHYNFNVVHQTTPAATITPSYPDAYHLTLTISPVYPGWSANMTVTVINDGNLPLKFYSFQMTSVSDTNFANYFYLGFLTPSNTYNVGPTSLNYYSTLHTYEGDWGIPAAAITLQPGATQASTITLSVDPSLPMSWSGQTLSVTFQLQATLAT